MSIFLCLLDYERRLLATVRWIVATNLAFRRKVSPTETSELTHYLFFAIFGEIFIQIEISFGCVSG